MTGSSRSSGHRRGRAQSLAGRFGTLFGRSRGASRPATRSKPVARRRTSRGRLVLPRRFLVFGALFGLLILLAPTAIEATGSAAWWFFGLRLGPRAQAAVAQEGNTTEAPRPPRAIAASWTDADLERRLRAAVPSDLGEVSFWVKNTATGATATLQPDRPHPAASLVKIPILVETLSQVGSGGLRLDDALLIEPEDWEDGAGVLQAQVGTRHSVERLLTLMTGVSDNIATAVLLDRIGRESVNVLAQRLALPMLRIHTASPATDPLGPDEPNRASARDVGELLEALVGGRLLDADRTALALRLMQQPQPSDWLGPGIPTSVAVAHKTGELPGVRHDCGVVFAGNGPYVLCVLTSDLTDQDEAAATISTIARLTFQHFQRK